MKNTRDDLKFIQGISSKIEGVLNKAGFKNFEQIAKANSSKFNAVLAKAGLKGHAPYVNSWSEQAKLAGSGKWSDLVKKQKSLKKK
jgi:predicted flap endonuclease-1-like 5' DNA nuclease